MAEDQIEKEHPQIRKVELDEWIHPFENYNNIPYNPYSETKMAKTLDFVTNGYNWQVIVEWDQQEIQDFQDQNVEEAKKALVVLLDKEVELTPAEIIDYQKRFESRLTLLIVGSNNETGRHNPPSLFQIIFRLPSGTLLMTKMRPLERWPIREFDYDAILIPDIDNIMESIEMRIERIFIKRLG